MSGTIKQAIDLLKLRIANAYAAVANKGGTLPTTQDSANLVSAIESIPAVSKALYISRGGELGTQTIFIDFDGTPLYAYTKEEILALEELPKPYTTHERLTFVKWNYTLEEIKERVELYDWIDVGAMYVPTDGWGEIEIEIDGIDGLQYTPHFRMWIRYEGVLTIDWGDGVVDEYEGKDFDVKHTYANKGKYLVRFISTTQFFGIYAYNDTKALVVGRFVFPTDSYNVGCNHEGSGMSGGNNPIENNGGYSLPQCLSYTRIETIVIPPSCTINSYNYGSGLSHMYCLKSIVSDADGSVWRTIDYSFPSVRFFSIRGSYSNISNSSAFFIGARSTIFRLSQNHYLSLYAGSYENLERIQTTNYINLGASNAVSLPSIRNLNGYSIGREDSFAMFWVTGGITNMRYCTKFPKPTQEGVFAYYLKLDGNIAIRDYEQQFKTGSGNNFPTFQNNTSLQTVSLRCEGTTKNLLANSFNNNYSLKEVKLIYVEPTIESPIVALKNINAFTNCPKDMKIYVPAILLDAYKTATNWSTYADQIYADPNQE